MALQLWCHITQGKYILTTRLPMVLQLWCHIVQGKYTLTMRLPMVLQLWCHTVHGKYTLTMRLPKWYSSVGIIYIYIYNVILYMCAQRNSKFCEAFDC